MEETYQLPNDTTKINYIQFNTEIELIFTEKGLERDPTKKLTAFNAPSILDPKHVLQDQEE